jgi:hypothetical protein
MQIEAETRGFGLGRRLSNFLVLQQSRRSVQRWSSSTQSSRSFNDSEPYNPGFLRSQRVRGSREGKMNREPSHILLNVVSRESG